MLNMLIPAISNYNLMSKSTLKTFDMYARMIAETEYYVTIIDILINYIEDLASTEFGERFLCSFFSCFLGSVVGLYVPRY
jgi:hypothetical protein